MYTKVVSVLSTGAATQDITFTPKAGDPASWTPKLAIFRWSRSNTSVAAFAEHMSTGYGFTNGTASRCVAIASEDNQARGDSARIQRNDALLCALNPSGTIETVDAIATFNSWLTNGIRINWTDAPAANFSMHVMFIGGLEITDVSVGSLLTGTATGNISETGLAYQPDFGFFISANTTTENSPVVNAIQSIGAATSSSAQWNENVLTQDNPVTMITRQYYSHTKVVTSQSTAGAIDGYATFTSFNSNGFTLNVGDAFPASFPIYYLVVKGGSWAVGNGTEPASTGNQTVTTSKDTKGIMMFGLKTATADTPQNGHMSTVAFEDGAARGYVLYEDTNGLADSVVVSISSTTAIYAMMTANATAGSSTTSDSAGLFSQGSTGFVIQWTNVGGARPYRYISFGTGIIQVTKTLTLRYDVKKEVTKQLTTIYNVRNEITPKQLTLRYDVRAEVTKQLTTKYNILVPIAFAKKVSLNWAIGDNDNSTLKLIKRDTIDTASPWATDPYFSSRTAGTDDSIILPINAAGNYWAEWVSEVGAFNKLNWEDGEWIIRLRVISVSHNDIYLSNIDLERVTNDLTFRVTADYYPFDDFDPTIAPIDPSKCLQAGKTYIIKITADPDRFNSVNPLADDRLYLYLEFADLTTTVEKSIEIGVNLGEGNDEIITPLIAIGQVTKTSTIKYNILSETTKQLTTKYDIRQEVTKQLTTRYDIRKEVTKTNTLLYNVIKEVTKTNTLRYDIRKEVTKQVSLLFNVSVPITKQVTILYNILQEVTKTNTVRYDVIAQVTKAVNILYNITTTVEKINQLKYNINAEVTKTNTLLYNITNTVTKTNTLLYNILQEATKSTTIRYDIIAEVTKTLNLLYDVESAINQVVKTLSLRYNIDAQTVKTTTLKYNINNTIEKTNTLRYDIKNEVTKQATLLYNIDAQVTKIINLLYNINNEVTKTNTLRYNINNFVTKTNTILYNILKEVTKTNTLRYDVIAQVTKTNTLLYDIENALGVVVKTLTLAYDIRQEVTKSVTIRYDLLKEVEKQVTLRYDMLKEVLKTNTLLYNIIAQTVKSTTIRYNVNNTVEKTNTLIYNINTYVEATKTLRYDMKAEGEKDTTLLYNIIAQVTKTNTLQYNILNEVTKSNTLLFNILQEAEKSVTLRYDVKAEVEKLLRLRYDILKSIVKTTSIIYNILPLNAIEHATMHEQLLDFIQTQYSLNTPAKSAISWHEWYNGIADITIDTTFISLVPIDKRSTVIYKEKSYQCAIHVWYRDYNDEPSGQNTPTELANVLKEIGSILNRSRYNMANEFQKRVYEMRIRDERFIPDDKSKGSDTKVLHYRYIVEMIYQKLIT